MSGIENLTIDDLDCPGCKTRIPPIRVASVGENEIVTCPGCRETIKLKGLSDVGRGLRKIQAAFDALGEHPDEWELLAELFGTDSTAVVLRAAELTGRPLAVVTPSRVYARGRAEWPDEQTLRAWARNGAPGLRRAVLRDDRRRVVLEGPEEEVG